MCDVTLLAYERNTCTNASWFLETIASTVTRGAVQPRGPGKALELLHTGKVHAWGECQRSRRHVECTPKKLSDADMIPPQRTMDEGRDLRREECVDGMQTGDATAPTTLSRRIELCHLAFLSHNPLFLRRSWL